MPYGVAPIRREGSGPRGRRNATIQLRSASARAAPMPTPGLGDGTVAPGVPTGWVGDETGTSSTTPLAMDGAAIVFAASRSMAGSAVTGCVITGGVITGGVITGGSSWCVTPRW